MSSRQEPLEPTPFEPAAPGAPTPEKTHAAPRWVLPALLTLGLLAVSVVMWTPDPPAPPADGAAAPQPAVQATGAPAANQPTSQAGPQSSPWSEAQAAKLRAEAKAVLEQLLDVQFELDERHVQEWAGEDYANATAVARRGDELYREQAYAEARESYAGALQQMEAIRESLPEAVDAKLREAEQAIENVEAGAARAALDLAALIDPANTAIGDLAERVDKLPALGELLEAASAQEESGDLASAEQSLAEAAALDPAHRRAATELERVTAAHRDQQFSAAMSEGYRALDSGEFIAARGQFKRAAGLRPNATEAASALQEVAVAEQTARLAALKQQGAGLEAAERWQEAVGTYRKAQAIDASVLFAAEGMQRAQPRAALDRELRAVIDDPGRLAEVPVAEAAAGLLQTARQVQPAGPLLRQQIDTLRELLDKANTPVQVTLRSDGVTEVLVYRVAMLGRFEKQTLALRPGTYQVRGSRTGYRDVLQTLKVTSDGPPPALTVICTESIL